jgi:two-component system, LytTR family, response regulator
MRNITVLVVEDDLIEALRIENSLKELGFNILPIADNVKDALGVFYSADPDIVLIDINLKGDKNGIDLGEHISSNQKYVKPIIYLTSMQDNEVFQRAKTTNPYAYLIKPADTQSLQRTIELAMQQFADNKYGFSNSGFDSGIIHKDYIFVKKGKKMVRLEIDDISYVEVESKYCTLHSETDKFLVRISLIDLLNFLPSSDFQRINRNYVVNLKKVNEFDFEDMSVSSGKSVLPISQKYKKELISKIDCLQ